MTLLNRLNAEKEMLTAELEKISQNIINKNNDRTIIKEKIKELIKKNTHLTTKAEYLENQIKSEITESDYERDRFIGTGFMFAIGIFLTLSFVMEGFVFPILTGVCFVATIIFFCTDVIYRAIKKNQIKTHTQIIHELTDDSSQLKSHIALQSQYKEDVIQFQEKQTELDSKLIHLQGRIEQAENTANTNIHISPSAPPEEERHYLPLFSAHQEDTHQRTDYELLCIANNSNY